MSKRERGEAEGLLATPTGELRRSEAFSSGPESAPSSIRPQSRTTSLTPATRRLSRLVPAGTVALTSQASTRYTAVDPAGVTPATVTWSAGVEGALPETALATPDLLRRELYMAAAIREPVRYPRQKNIQGRYFFRSSGQHVWHESQLESSVMRWLDMRSDIIAVTSQPFLIDFPDGTSHTPDLLALHADHRQVLYDVKPKKFIPDYLEQFGRTRALCEHIGFGYEVHHELPRQVDINLHWVSGFKHPGYHPGDEAERRLHDALGLPLTVRAAASALCPRDLPRGRAGLLHLAWVGAVTLDLSRTISDRTLIERNH